MVLTPLDVNDPQPRREEPHFNGDYNAFRKADKAWNKRERNRRAKQAKLQASAPVAECLQQAAHAEQQAEQCAPAAGVSATVAGAAHPKPRGRAPTLDGAVCTWDKQKGCWLDAASNKLDWQAKRAAINRAWVVDVHQRKLKAVAELDDAIVCILKQLGKPLYTENDPVYAVGSMKLTLDYHAKYASIFSDESFLAQLRELGCELQQVRTKPWKSKRCRCARHRPPGCHRCQPGVDCQVLVRRSADYWRVVNTEIGTLEEPGPLFSFFGSGEIGGRNHFLGLLKGGCYTRNFCRLVQSQLAKLWRDRVSVMCGGPPHIILPEWIVRYVRREEGEEESEEGEDTQEDCMVDGVAMCGGM